MFLKIEKKNGLSFPLTGRVIVFGLVLCIFSCQKQEEDAGIHKLDKKYFSESQLFGLNKAIEDDPDEPDNFFKQAKIYLDRNEKKKALTDINKALSLKGTEGKYYYLKAQIFHKLNLPDSSLSAAETAEGLRVHDAELKILLSTLHLEKGNTEEARGYLDQALALTPHHPEVFFLKGKFEASKGDTASAISSYYITLNKDTNNADAYKELSSIYFRKKKYDSSLIFVAGGKMADPEDPFFPYQEGLVLERSNLHGSAKAHFNNSLRLDSTFAPSYIALANLSLQQGDNNQAVKMLQSALRYNPDDKSSNLKLADIYQKQEKGVLAIPYLERVAKLDTANKTVKATLEKLYKAYPEWMKPVVVNQDSINKAKKDSIDKANAAPATAPKKDSVGKKDKPANQTKTTGTPPAATEKNKKKPDNETSKENRNFIPIITNPDSSKIEVRPDQNR